MSKTIFKLFKEHFPLIFFLTFYLLIVSYKLIFHPTPFFDWDESLYVQTGKEMIEQKSFFIPVWQKEYWLDKTPLTSLFYGSVLKIFYFFPAEITTRLISLFISITILIFMYFFYRKIIKDKLIINLIIILTAFTPLFLQRAQTVNADIFVLLGWLGYILFFNNFFLGLFFLSTAVMSKSLIGFYPVAILSFYHGYLFLSKKIKQKDLKQILTKILLQISILSGWYLTMFAVFGKQFWLQHIVESHFRRVSSSIEFHFGQRTFYIDLAREQYGLFFWLAVAGLILIFIKWKKAKVNKLILLHGLYLLPWFIFLNLTKTKIFWYIYPSLPQFAFLALQPLTIFRKNKLIYFSLAAVTLLFIFYKAFFIQGFFTTYYAKTEPYYDLSLYAKKYCTDLTVLLDKQSRKSFAELEKLHLLITTTKWWGSHPSMIYYFGKKVNFMYSEKEINQALNLASYNNCAVIDKNDLDLKLENKGFTLLKNFDSYYLFRR